MISFLDKKLGISTALQELSSKSWQDSGWRTYSSPDMFNFLVNVEDYQGDGRATVTLTVFKHSLQYAYWFDNNKRTIAQRPHANIKISAYWDVSSLWKRNGS